MKILIKFVATLLVFGWMDVLGLVAANLPKVFFIGDNLNTGFVPFMRKELERTFLVEQKQLKDQTYSEKRWESTEGNSREVSVYLRNRRIKNPIHADVLLFNCGLQDICMNPGTADLSIGLEKYRENLRAIISEARKMKLEPLWFNTIPVFDSIHNCQIIAFSRGNADVDIYNKVAEEVMAQEKVVTIDFNTFCKPFVPGVQVDAIHFMQSVQQKQGAFLAEALNQWWAACAVNNPSIKREKLWPDLPPAYESFRLERINSFPRVDHVSVPEIVRFLPKKRKSATAVILFPGGGYRFLGFLRNAKELSEKLDSLGIAVIGLKYRTGRLPEVPLLDAQRAVRYVRAYAKEWGIDPNRIGVAGQSAGANLVLNLCCNFLEGNPDAQDPVERESSRPDFMAVFSSWNYGRNTSPFVFKHDMPPVFFRHAKDDSSFKLAEKLVSQFDEIGVSKDVLFLEKGGHGAFELKPTAAGCKWPDDLVSWLHKLNLW